MQWAAYMDAYGPLDYGERIFARLDTGFAFLATLIINRSGGIRSPGQADTVPGRPAQVRDFMWEPPPEREEEEEEEEAQSVEEEIAILARMFGNVRRKPAAKADGS